MYQIFVLDCSLLRGIGIWELGCIGDWKLWPHLSGRMDGEEGGGEGEGEGATPFLRSYSHTEEHLRIAKEGRKMSEEASLSLSHLMQCPNMRRTHARRTGREDEDRAACRRPFG